MKVAVFITLLLISTQVLTLEAWGTDAEEDDVVVLKNDTFDAFVAKHNFVLAEFYAPWCGHCKSLAPEYAKAAAKLKTTEPKAPLVKIDTTVEEALGKKFEIQGFPTLKFFINGSPVEYKGGRTADEIVAWVLKKSGPSTTLLETEEALEALKKDNKVLVVYFGEDNDSFKQFTAVSVAVEGVTFAHVFKQDLVAKQTSSVVMFRSFDEGDVNFSGALNAETSANFSEFLDLNRHPMVMEFEGDAAIERIFGKEQAAMFMFSESEGSHTTEFKALAAANKGKMIFSTSAVTTGLGMRLAEYVGIKAADAPCVRIVQPKDGDLQKFVFSGALNQEKLQEFMNNYTQGTLERTFKTAEVPATNNEGVKIAVGSTFNDMVLNNDKDVLVEFYAPWCGHCKTLAPIYETVAQKVAHMDHILLVKVDSTENEIPSITVKGFPTLKFFKSGRKDTPMDYEAGRTEEEIMKYLKENQSGTWSDDAKAAPAETDL